METIRILLVEDEPFLAKVVKESLEQRKFVVVHAADGAKAYSQFQNGVFSLCIVDVMLPHTDGFTFVRQIRASNVQIPVLFLTALTGTNNLIEGYQSGGNDYLKKPFSLEELFLRINELLRRTISVIPLEATIQVGGFDFTPHRQTLQFGEDAEVKLSHRETQLLEMLYVHRNKLLDRKQVLLTIWRDDSIFNTRTMDVFITKLRKHLKRDPSVQILNLRGLGYKLIC